MANLTTTDLDNGKTDLETLSTVVNSQTETTTVTRLGDTIKTVKGLTDEFEQAIATGESDFEQAIINSGYQVLGSFASGVTITSINQVLDYDGGLYRTTESLPYTTDGTTPDSDSGEWVVVSDGILSGIARSLTVSDSEVIYSTDTATILDNVLYIYDASSQVIWLKPSSVEAGEVIVSVVGDELTTTTGIYTMIQSLSKITFNNISEAVTSTPLAVGVIVETIGYSTPGDGGGSRGIVKNGAHTEDMGSIFTIYGDYYIEFGFEKEVSAKQFGIFPDSGNNETTQINRAIDYCIEKSKTLTVQSGAYSYDGITRTIDAQTVSIVGVNGVAEFFGTSALSPSGRMFRFENGTNNIDVLSITQAPSVGDNSILVADVSGVEVGDVIHFSSDELWPYDNRGVYFKGEKHLITNVDSGTNTIYIEDFIRDNYTLSEIIHTNFWTPNTYIFQNIKTNLNEFGGSVGFQLSKGNTTIEHVECIGGDTAGVWLLDQISPRVKNYISRNVGGVSTSGYGIQDRGCVGLIIDGFESYGCRRSFDSHSSSGVNSSPSRDVLVTNFKIYGGEGYWPVTANDNYGIGNHGPSENVIYCDGEIHNCKWAVNFRGVKQKLSNIDVYGACNGVIDLTYGTGVEANGVTYKPEGYPNKGDNLGDLNTSLMPTAFISLGRSSTTDANADMTLPVKINSCSAIGLVNSVILTKGTTQSIENIKVYNSVFEPRPAGSVFYFVSASADFHNCNFEGNNIIRGSRDVALATISVSGSKVPVVVDGTYYIRIEDQRAAVVGSFLTPLSSRLTLAISSDAGGRGIYEFIPVSATLKQAGSIVFTALEATASPDSLNGSFGTDGKFTVGLTTDGKVVAENRTGSGRVYRFKLLA